MDYLLTQIAVFSGALDCVVYCRIDRQSHRLARGLSSTHSLFSPVIVYMIKRLKIARLRRVVFGDSVIYSVSVRGFSRRAVYREVCRPSQVTRHVHQHGFGISRRAYQGMWHRSNSHYRESQSGMQPPLHRRKFSELQEWPPIYLLWRSLQSVTCPPHCSTCRRLVRHR